MEGAFIAILATVVYGVGMGPVYEGVYADSCVIHAQTELETLVRTDHERLAVEWRAEADQREACTVEIRAMHVGVEEFKAMYMAEKARRAAMGDYSDEVCRRDGCCDAGGYLRLGAGFKCYIWPERAGWE